MDTGLTQTVAANVTAAIAAKDLSHKRVAEETGIPRTTLIRRLQGLAPFTISELGAIAGLLDVSVTELLDAA